MLKDKAVQQFILDQLKFVTVLYIVENLVIFINEIWALYVERKYNAIFLDANLVIFFFQ